MLESFTVLLLLSVESSMLESKVGLLVPGWSVWNSAPKQSGSPGACQSRWNTVALHMSFAMLVGRGFLINLLLLFPVTRVSWRLEVRKAKWKSTQESGVH